MAAVTADAVIVEVEGRYAQYARDFDRIIDKTAKGMAELNRLTAKPITVKTAAETVERESRKRVDAAGKEAAAVEKAAQRKATAEEKAAARATAAADKKAERERVAAERAAATAERAAQRKADAEEKAANRATAALEKQVARVAEINRRAQSSPVLFGYNDRQNTQVADQNAVAKSQSSSRLFAANRGLGNLLSGSSLSATSEKPINDALVQQIALRTQLAVAIEAGEEKAARAAVDQLDKLKLVSQYKRAGLSDTDAAARAENDLKTITDARAAAEAKAANGAVKGTARTAAATRNLGRQVADVGTSLAGGLSPFLIIAQQAPQVADALADTGGKAAKVAGFFAGPWGAALLAAGSVAAILASDLLKTGETVESLTAELQKNAEHSQLAAAADRIFAGTQAGLAGQIRDTTKAILAQTSALRTNAEAQNVNAKQEFEKAKADGTRLKAERDALIARRNAAVASGSSAGVRGLESTNVTARASLAKVEAEIKTNATSLAKATKAIELSRVALAAQQAATRSTATGRAAEPFDEKINKLQRDQTAAILKGAKVDPTLSAQIRTLITQRDAAVDAATATENGAKANTKAIAAATKTLGDLKELRDSASGSEKARLDKAVTKAERKLELLGSGVSTGAIGAATANGKSGPSAETLANKAKAATERSADNADRFNSENRALDDALLSARGRQSASIEQQANYAVAAAEQDFKDRTSKFEKLQRETGLDTSVLNAKSAQLLAQQKLTAATEKAAALADQTLQIQADSASAEADALRAQQAVEQSRAKRNQLELDIIKKEYDARRTSLAADEQRAIERGDTAGALRANNAQRNLPAQEAADVYNATRNARSPYQQYRDNLTDSDSLADSIDQIKIDTLQAVTDELANATTAALGLSGAFGDIVGELIRIGIQRKLIGPLADKLFGAADGSSGGVATGFLNSVTRLFGGGRASGGNVSAGTLYQVNEQRGGVEGFIPSQSGKIIPLGRMSAPTANTTIVKPQINVDARGAVMNDQFASMILRQADTSARAYAANAGREAYQNSPARLRRQELLGT